MKKYNQIGNILIVIALIILGVTFSPVIKEEVKYNIDKTLGVNYSLNPGEGSNEKKLDPPNTNFSIVIPKIAAVAPIVDSVDPSDSSKYLPALKKGVAHALRTKYPGQKGNTYLFAHSTDSFYNVGQYNAVFYLIGKLDNGDEVDLFYKGEKLTYEVYDKKIVDANASEYLGKIGEGSTLTLQTCYPPGTTLKRLVVLARLKK